MDKILKMRSQGLAWNLELIRKVRRRGVISPVSQSIAYSVKSHTRDATLIYYNAVLDSRTEDSRALRTEAPAKPLPLPLNNITELLMPHI